MKIYRLLYSLYYDLNPDFFKDLQQYCIEETDGTITLDELIRIYSGTPEAAASIDELKALKNDNSIGCMIDYYELINIMLETTGGRA